jgi:hypothetical protein
MMNAVDDAILLAKVIWDDPQSGETLELVLAEGDVVGIGRLETNAICIKEQHVSRQHAEIAYADGVFVVRDLGSANGVYVNDQRLTEPYPLVSGDIIRLYVPVLRFSALDDEEKNQTTEAGMMPVLADNVRGGRLLITNGPQEGSVVPLLLKKRHHRSCDQQCRLGNLHPRPLNLAPARPPRIDRHQLGALRSRQRQRHNDQRYARQREGARTARQ